MSLNRKRCLNTKRFLFIDGAGLIVGERFLSESFQCASDNLLKILEIRENVIVFERAKLTTTRSFTENEIWYVL